MPTVVAQEDNQGVLLQSHTLRHPGRPRPPDPGIQHCHVQPSLVVFLSGIFFIQMLGSLKRSVNGIEGKVTEEGFPLVSFDKGNRPFRQNLGQVILAVPEQNSFATDFRILDSTGRVALADNPAVMKNRVVGAVHVRQVIGGTVIESVKFIPTVEGHHLLGISLVGFSE